MFDGQAWGEELVAIVKDYVGAQTAPLLARIAALEARLAEPVPPPAFDEGRATEVCQREIAKLPPAAPPVEPELVRSLIVESVQKIVKALPPGPRGEPGPQGERGETGPPGERGEAGAKGDPGERGERGEPGEAGTRGERGEPGAKGETGERGEPGERGLQGERGSEGPQGETGEIGPPGLRGETGERGEAGAAGLPGERGLPGEKGATGEPGAPGRDGAGVVAALLDIDGALTLTMSDGRLVKLGVVVGRDGAPGAPGANGLDGLGFDDADLEYDGERTVTVRLKQGDRVKAFPPLVLPAMIYRDIYREGAAYARGDVVTWGGSLYHCGEPTSEQPGEGSKAWRLCAKRGRDGRDGAPGKDWTPPKPVKAGS